MVCTQGARRCILATTLLWSQGEAVVSLDPCQRHLVPGVWTLQGLHLLLQSRYSPLLTVISTQ